ncbi:HAD-IA family hydrolase, partial [Candidatus Woesearchaeota archaeon]|nr:HAD-IA family hydrolase [Candidatus Woesearchaeota archaeon]
IMSSNSEKTIKNILKKEKTSVDFIISENALFGKHFIFNKIIKKFKINKTQLLYVGDELRDIDAAKKAGIKIIAVTWGYNSKSSLKRANPDFVVNDVKELEKLLI